MGQHKDSTSVRYDKGEVRNRADMAIVQKVFEFFDVLSANYGQGWLNIHKTLSPDNKPNVLRLDQLWINFQHKYDFNPPHDHSVFSFVIFGDIDEKIFTENAPPTNANVSGKLCFSYGEQITKLQANSFTIEPYRGLMFVFPLCTSTLCSTPFYTDYERISISGNYVLQSPGNNIRPMTKEQEQKLNLK